MYKRCDTEISTEISQMSFYRYKEWIRNRNWLMSIKRKYEEQERMHLLEGEALALVVQ